MTTNTILADALSMVILAAIPALLSLLYTYLRKHFSARDLSLAFTVAQVAVNAAEQMGAARGWASADKFDHALLSVRDLGAHAGIRYSDAAWSSLIEHCVAELKQFGHEIATPAPPPVILPVVPPA